MEIRTISISSVGPKGAFCQGEPVVLNGFETFGAFMKACYKNLEISYPKFFKMDRLCKLCFIAAELLLKDSTSFKSYTPEKVAVILQNYHSSLYSDSKHFESIRNKDNYFPSPSVFVYTLPNIMIGELCIRNGITGEATCFLADNNDTSFIDKYVHSLFEDEGYQACITGSVDYSDDSYFAELLLMERTT